MNEIILINPGTTLLEKGLVLNSLERKLRELQLKYAKEKLISCGIKIKKEAPLYSYQISRGLLCIATKLIEAGYKPIYLQMDYERERNPSKTIEQILNSYAQNAKIVGITSYTFNFDEAIEIAKTLKTINPEIKIIFGGHHVTWLDIETLQSPYVDVVVRGEGENTFRNVCQCLLDEKNLDDIKGITYKNSGKIIRNSPAPLIKGEEIPIPSYSLIRSIKNPTVVLETTRGCPMHCLFCEESAFWKSIIRHREINDVLEEIEIIKSLFGYDAIHICDSYFPINKKYAIELLNEIKKEKIEMNFSCDLRINQIDKEMLTILSESDFYEVFVGIESGSDKVLREMRKGFTFHQCYITLKKIRKYIPLIDSAWMIGHPGEDKNTIKETQKKIRLLLNEELIDKVWPKIFIPYPGIEPFYFPEKYGIEIITKEWKNYLRTSFPVHRLKTLSEAEIYESYKEIIELIIKYFENKIL